MDDDRVVPGVGRRARVDPGVGGRHVDDVQRGDGHHGGDRICWGQLYKNRSSRKIDSLILFSKEWDFPKTFSLNENQFSGKTYFIQLVPAAAAAAATALDDDGEEEGFFFLSLPFLLRDAVDGSRVLKRTRLITQC